MTLLLGVFLGSRSRHRRGRTWRTVPTTTRSMRCSEPSTVSPVTVWLTVHHEPEGGEGINQSDDPAGPSGHLAMNRRVRQRMTALGVDNVALAPVLMGWTWDSRSGRNPDDWWDPDIYDFIGVDHYEPKEATLVNSLWSDIREWAEDEGVDIAVGEWGMFGSDKAAGQRVHEWYNAAVNSYRDGKGARVVGLAAFDSPNVWYHGRVAVAGRAVGSVPRHHGGWSKRHPCRVDACGACGSGWSVCG